MDFLTDFGSRRGRKAATVKVATAAEGAAPPRRSASNAGP